LANGKGVSIDKKGAAHYYKLAVDQGYADAQYNYGNCLKKGEGVSTDFKGAAHYFILAADQGIAAAQLNYGFEFLKQRTMALKLKQFVFDRPRMVFQTVPDHPETQTIRALLQNKKPFSTTVERLQLFLSASGDFTTRVTRPLPVDSEEDDIEDSKSFEINFINPVPLFWTGAALFKSDVSQEEETPSIVAECAAKWEKYGIVPPPAPPRQAPLGDVTMSSIYATLKTERERGSDVQVELEPVLEQGSIQLAEMINWSEEPLEEDEDRENWTGSRSFMRFEPLRLQIA
jgi:hypothetical protein